MFTIIRRKPLELRHRANVIVFRGDDGTGKPLKIVNTSGTYTVLSDDDVIVAVGLPLTVILEAIPANGRTIQIKDGIGSANAGNPITVSGNGNNIDGSPTLVIKAKYGSIEIVYNQVTGAWIIG